MFKDPADVRCLATTGHIRPDLRVHFSRPDKFTRRPHRSRENSHRIRQISRLHHSSAIGKCVPDDVWSWCRIWRCCRCVFMLILGGFCEADLQTLFKAHVSVWPKMVAWRSPLFEKYAKSLNTFIVVPWQRIIRVTRTSGYNFMLKLVIF